jgi:homoserine O-succinyltransferase
MPDGAFEATEHQFLDLLAVASGEEIIEVRRHTMNGIDRSPSIMRYVKECYRPSSDIRETPPDILIVTGSNPIEARIDAEPYWDEMSDLLHWASMNVSTMLLSCLAAHAALLIFDDIARVRLDEKCTGVFRQNVDAAHPLGARIGRDVLLPHSRINTADVVHLREREYSIVIESPRVGWSVATKTIGRCDLVLIQAHPEYEPSSLLREYRRDARRYVARERADRPVLPYHCVGDEDWPQLEGLQAALVPSERGVVLLDDYPFEDVSARAPWPWRDMAQQLYANWLSGVRIEKGDTHA